MEEPRYEEMLFLPSVELARRWGETYPWEEKMEELVKARVQKHGRVDFDYSHTKAVVNWAKIIGQLEDLPSKDREILAATAWLHDIGYDFSGANDTASQLDVMRKQKEKHMRVGAEIANEWYENESILNKSFNRDNWSEVTDLIGQHDQSERIEKGEHHRLLPYFVAADTLGQIDVRGGVKHTFGREDTRRYIAETLSKRARVVKGKSGQALIILVNQFLRHLNEGGK